MLTFSSISRRVIVAIAATGALASAALPAASAEARTGKKPVNYCTTYGDKPITQLRSSVARWTVDCLINEARTANGVAPLEHMPAGTPLYISANTHARKSVRLRWWSPTDGSVSHIDPETGMGQNARILAAGYCPGGTANTNENTFTSSGVWAYPATPRGAVSWWLQDPPHRATLLNPAYTQHAIAIVPGLAMPGPEYDPAGTFVEDLGSCS